MKKFLQEFKEFALRGNVMDMAVGVVVGGAFSAIVGSLVNDIIMPLIAGLLRLPDFTALTANIGDATLAYGNFIQNIVNFVIIAFCIFSVVKAINSLKRKEEPKPEAPKGPTDAEKIIALLEDIKNK